MKAFLIDPTTQTISEVEVNEEDQLNEIYRLTHCTCFCIWSLPNDDAIYVDDEGLLNGTVLDGAFMVTGPGQNWLVGRGLVLGHDRKTGNSIPPLITLDDLRARTIFGAPALL